jgi:hypothetical protein
VIFPGRYLGDSYHHHRHPAKPDRWLVGLLAGAALMYLAGKLLRQGEIGSDARPARRGA